MRLAMLVNGKNKVPAQREEDQQGSGKQQFCKGFISLAPFLYERAGIITDDHVYDCR
jgi:hypothetical protein